jgi:hypothetical protein
MLSLEVPSATLRTGTSTSHPLNTVPLHKATGCSAQDDDFVVGLKQ